MTDKTKDILSLVEQINTILKEGEPGNISKDTYSGYVGYKPQSTIDAVNTVLGPNNWGFEEVSITRDSDIDPKIFIYNIRVWLFHKEVSRTAYGQSRITKGDFGDGMKGAQTDALKKALSYFSIGNRAYLGQLETTEKKVVQAPAKELITPKQLPTLMSLLSKKGVTKEQIYKQYKVESISDISEALASTLIDYLMAKKDVAREDMENIPIEVYDKAVEEAWESEQGATV